MIFIRNYSLFSDFLAKALLNLIFNLIEILIEF